MSYRAAICNDLRVTVYLVANGRFCQASTSGQILSVMALIVVADTSIPMLTLITFGIAIVTPPLAGAYCAGSCFDYPYTDIVFRFPRDYIWMYPAIFLLLVYYGLMVCVHHLAREDKKIFSHIGLSFALISTAVLVIDYFLQVSVVQQSLLKAKQKELLCCHSSTPRHSYRS